MPMGTPCVFRYSTAPSMTTAFMAVSLDHVFMVSISSHQEAGVAFCKRA
jgi:hypothetical protein